MFYKSFSANISIVTSCILLLTISPLFTWAVRRPIRSVIQCDQQDPKVIEKSDEHYCERYCKQRYVKKQDGYDRANEHLSQGNLRYKSGVPECCCLFEAPWFQFVNAQPIGRQEDEAAVGRLSKLNCLPLAMGIFLSRRVRKSYETICKYLIANKPMTILELMQFAEAAKYLNYIQPSHPSIWLLLSNKQIKRIQKAEFAELENALNDYLLDDSYDWIGWPRHPGYHLDTSRLTKILETINKISNALKSSFVARSLDELAISQVLVDVMAASTRVQLMNNHTFMIPRYLLNGDYDKYSPDLAYYFTLPDLDCELLSEFTKQISLYLNKMESVLGKLHEKLVFVNMTRNNQNLKQILSSKRIYENLLKVNCNGK